MTDKTITQLTELDAPSENDLMAVVDVLGNETKKIKVSNLLAGSDLVQKKMMEAFLGFDNGSSDTQIFDNAQKTTQGLAYANFGGADKIYLLQPVVDAGSFNSREIDAGDFDTGTLYEIVTVGTTDFTAVGSANNTVGTRFTATGSGSGSGVAAVVESQRIVEYTLADDGSVVSNNVFTGVLNLAHQGLSALVDGSSLYLYTQHSTQPTHRGQDAGKGFSKILWNGASTSSVTNYQLFGYSGSGHVYENFFGASVGVSSDGKYVILLARDTTGGDLDDTNNWCFIYDRAQVEALADPLDAVPVSMFIASPPEKTQRTIYTQGIASDGKFVYVLRGYYPARQHHIIQKFDFQGNLISEVQVDGPRAQYGLDGLLDHPTLGLPRSFEPEGLALKGNDLLVLDMDNWETVGDIVTFNGKSYAAVRDTLDVAPDSREGYLSWVETTKTANDGAWSSTTSYSDGGTYTRKSKVIYSVGSKTGASGEEPLDQGIVHHVTGANINLRENSTDISVVSGQTVQVKEYSELTASYKDIVKFNSSGFAQHLHDTRSASDNTKYNSLKAQFEVTPNQREFFEIRSRSSVSEGAGINLYGGGDYLNADRVRLYAGGTFSSNDVFVDLVNGGAPVFRPNGGLDGQVDLGGASNRWDTVYALTGTISTSDERTKQDIADLTTAERNVAVAIKGVVKSFRFRDAVSSKGDDARIHFGVIAQDVQAAFVAEGLDPNRYALFCHDTWEEEGEENGVILPSGDRYGIRYDELLAFIIAAI
jgi:hypothetical protein